MYIHAAPGPRAEAWVQRHKTPLKFGSTRDFFAYVLDPENQTGLQHLLVQDSARINWQRPSNAADTFVDARSAWYVAWQPLSGEMGPTFASFGTRHDADAFVRVHGGAVLRFSEITPALTTLLGYACPGAGSPAFALSKSCVKAPASDAASDATQDEQPDLLRRADAAPHGIHPRPQVKQPAVRDNSSH